jgi:hypothetical protein
VDGRLWAAAAGEAVPVQVRRCFPWSAPTRFISLRDENEAEVALIRDTAHLDAASRSALERALAEAGFVFLITGVLEVEDEVEIRRWKVVTTQGPRSFQTRLDDWPTPLGQGGLLMRDLAGDLYRLEGSGMLDRRSRELLWAFVD